MDASVQNFLYRNPEYYERVYPRSDESQARLCRRMIARYRAAPAASLLDLGCGTGRDLDVLAQTVPECWGVDCLPEMIAFGQARRPHLRLQTADMRTVRLGRTFDVIISMGSAFMYALTNADVAGVLDTYAAHAHAGTLLILDMWNAASFLGGGAFRETVEFKLDTPDFTATGVAVYGFDRRGQSLVRRRTWHIEGQPSVEDFCQYRLFFPAEIEHLLTEKGFRTAGMFDNADLDETDLSGSRLYVAATR